MVIKTKTYILILLIASLLVAAAPVRADHATDREYKIKAAFVYNFIKFIDWPQKKTPGKDGPITIGILGSNILVKAFDPVKNKQVKGRRLIIKQFEECVKLEKSRKKNDSAWKEKLEALRKCQVLFICTCESEATKIPVEVIKALKGSGILLVGEMPGFLENGGVINFVMENKKVRFEINTAAAERSGLKIRSQLLKLAKRVIKSEQHKETKD